MLVMINDYQTKFEAHTQGIRDRDLSILRWD
jgi:hypothetical protein